MNKLIIAAIAFVALAFASCSENNEIDEHLIEYSNVSAWVPDKVILEKSAENFKPVFSPFDVTVRYTNMETYEHFDCSVNSDSTFFRYGTPELKLPYGFYEVHVEMKGQWNLEKSWSSWYESFIRDTIIEVNRPELKIAFNVAYESALVVRPTKSNYYKGIDMEQRVYITRLNSNLSEVQWTERQSDVFSYLKEGLYQFDFNDTYGHKQSVNLFIEQGEKYQINLPEKADRNMCDEFTIIKI